MHASSNFDHRLMDEIRWLGFTRYTTLAPLRIHNSASSLSFYLFSCWIHG
jgi:hypothetical protein